MIPNTPLSTELDEGQKDDGLKYSSIYETLRDKIASYKKIDLEKCRL